MIHIQWDDKLPSNRIPTEIEYWDGWFALVFMSKEWTVIKEQFPSDFNRQLMWARIMELNRISATTEKARGLQ